MTTINSINNEVTSNDFAVTRTLAATACVSSINHSDNTNTASHALNHILTGGASGGDPFTLYEVDSVTDWSSGIDNSDSDIFKIGPNADPSTGTASIGIKTTGDITFNEVYEFPIADGTAGQVLKTDGAGNVDWGTTAGTGEFVQIQYGTNVTVVDCNTVMPHDDTIPQQAEGDEVITATITPTSATSLLVIDFVFSGATTGDFMNAALFQDATDNAIYAIQIDKSGLQDQVTVGKYIMVSGTTSATTFKVRVGPTNNVHHYYLNGTQAGGARIFGGVNRAVLSVMEIAQ